MRMSLPAVVSILVLGASPLAADHWPQWRGPTLNGETQAKTCRSAGRRLRTSPGSWQCLSGPDRRPSSGAITCSSTSAKDRLSRSGLWIEQNGTVRWKRPSAAAAG